MSPGIYYATVPAKTYTPIPVVIGDQVWDKMNLNTSHYRDGTPIQYNYTSTTSTIGAYVFYDYYSPYGTIYGKLYNWYAVDNVKNIAPVGWRVATPADWDALATYLGGASIAGNKLKQSGTEYWQPTNTGATNSSGFTALPAGLFSMAIQTFLNINQFAYFRTSDSADVRRLIYNSAAITAQGATNFSFYSVRLIKIIVELTTTTPTAVSPTFSSLSTGGNISNLNGFTLTSWGVCYSTSPNPTTSNNISVGSGTGSTGPFTSIMSGLTANTTYYIKAYVTTNSNETFYGQQVIGITTGTSTITTTAITNVMTTSATSGGTITSSAGNTITQSGICWSTSQLPTTANAKTIDGQTGVAPPNKTCGTGLMTALLQSTTYYVRAYVTTTADTTYGNQETFTTNAGDVLKASYSLRKTVSSYSGAAVTVRGIITSSTIIADVSFNASGWVETDSAITIISGTYTGGLTLGAFATLASTVWVQTWYDQSGNAKNVTQAVTITRQPTIAVSGTLNRAGVNNKVALKFLRTNSSWMVSATDTSLALNNTQVYMVCNSDTPSVTTYSQIGFALNATNRYYSGVFGIGTGSPSTGAQWLGYGTTSATSSSALLLTPAKLASQLFYSISNSSSITGYINDTFRITYNETNTANSASINIGSNSSGGAAPFNGSIQEVQIYTPSATPNRQEVSDNIRTYYGIPAGLPTT